MKKLLIITILTATLFSNAFTQYKQPTNSRSRSEWDENVHKGNIKSAITVGRYSDSILAGKTATDTISIKRYNESGQLIEQLNRSTGENGVYEKLLLTYNEQRQLVQREYVDYTLPDTLTTIYTYNDKGLVEKQVTTRIDDSDEIQVSKLTYNEHGDITNHYYCHTVDSSSYSNTQYEYRYDEQGRIIEVKNVSISVWDTLEYVGNPIVTTKEYDQQGRLVKSVATLQRSPSDAPVISATAYKYDGQDRITEVTKYEGGREIATLYEYDREGNMVRLTKGKDTTVYQYDEHNNWIRSTTSPDSKNSYICERTIEYY